MMLLAIDVGTTALKAGLLIDGEIARVEQVAYPLHTPRPGWAEQDPVDWWQACVEAVRLLAPGAVSAVAVTGQMQDLIPIGHDGALGRAILYSDQRAGGEHRVLSERLTGWAERAGAQPDATNVAAKWAWLRAAEPDRAASTRTVLLGGHSFVVHRLTGRALCDPTTAATTGLFDVGAGVWWDAVVDAVGIPVPEVAAPAASSAPLLAEPAGELGIAAGIPVIHGPGDAVATTIGIVGTALGSPYAYLGTSGWVAAGAAQRQTTAAIWLPGAEPSAWVAAAPMLTAGAAADWARATLLGGVDHAGFDHLAGSACAAAQGVAFIPHLDGVRTPLADGDATGVLIGARRSTDRATVAAAVLEGIAHAVRASAGLVAPDATAMALCGGLSASPVCVQILADVCNVPIRAVAGVDAALRGAASVALAAVGDADLGPAPTVSVVQPRAEHASIHHVLATVFDTSLRQLGPAFGALASIRRSISNNHFTQGEQT